MADTGGKSDAKSRCRDVITGILPIALLAGVIAWATGYARDRTAELRRSRVVLQIQSEGIVAGESGRAAEQDRLVRFCPSILVLAGAGDMPAAQERELHKAILDCRSRPFALHEVNPGPSLIIDKGATPRDLELAIRLGRGGGRCAVLVPGELPLFQGRSGIDYQLDGGTLPNGVCLTREL